MTPSNRRIKRASLPPDVMDAAASESLRAPFEPPVSRPVSEAPSWLAMRAAAVAKDAVGLLLVVGISVGAAWGAQRYVSTSPRFAVTEIVVEGNHFRARDALLERAGIHAGTNVFALDLDAAQSRLEADPWVAEATLARRLPDAIVVSVKEREAAAVVTIDADAYLSTKQGEMFKRLEVGDPSDFPVITGVTGEEVSRDRGVVARAIVRALDLASDYEHSALSQKQPLQEVHLSQSGGIILMVGRGGTQLVLGGPPYRRKLEEAARVTTELERRGAKADAIFLDNDTRPERVVARVK